jgi:hypothetical protein
MTVLTTPAGSRQDAGTKPPPPVPWRQMLWVTWRQHRGLLIGVLAAFIAAVAGLLTEGLRIRHDYAALTACHPAASPACVQLSNFFGSTDWHVGNGVRAALLAAPVLLAMFAGPPVIARELENSTFRYAWTQGIGRMRWTITKLTLLGSVLTITALLISQLFTWFFAPFVPYENLAVLTGAVFITRGVAYAAWTLTAFCLGAFLGALVRRTIPAMAITLGAYLALAGVAWLYLRPHYPLRTFWPMQVFEAGWLLALSAGLAAGTVWLVRRHAA